MLNTNLVFFPAEVKLKIGEQLDYHLPDLGQAIRLPFFTITLKNLARSRDRDEEHNDDLFEAWLEEDHHQGEDLWRLPGPGV